MLSLPLEEEYGNNDADNEDDSEHWPHHPQQTLFLIHDGLRIHIRWGHRFRIRARGVHRLEECGVMFILTHSSDGTIFGCFLEAAWVFVCFYSHSPTGRAVQAQRKHTLVHSAVDGCGSRRNFARHLAWTPGGGSYNEQWHRPWDLIGQLVCVCGAHGWCWSCWSLWGAEAEEKRRTDRQEINKGDGWQEEREFKQRL